MFNWFVYRSPKILKLTRCKNIEIDKLTNSTSNGEMKVNRDAQVLYNQLILTNNIKINFINKN